MTQFKAAKWLVNKRKKSIYDLYQTFWSSSIDPLLIKFRIYEIDRRILENLFPEIIQCVQLSIHKV